MVTRRDGVFRLALRVALLTTIAVVTACASAAAPGSTPAATAAASTATSAPTPTPTPTAAPTSTPQPATPSPAATPSATPRQSGATTVEIGDNFYLPETVIITTGSRVTWVNRGQMTHTASARDDSFNSGNLEFGQTYERVFAVVGRYTYYCVQHEDMIGIVEVR